MSRKEFTRTLYKETDFRNVEKKLFKNIDVL
jgi:hypothetical protein